MRFLVQSTQLWSREPGLEPRASCPGAQRCPETCATPTRPDGLPPPLLLCLRPSSFADMFMGITTL